MRFGPTSFSGDTEVKTPISSFGPLTANGNLYATQIKVNGPCTVRENLEIESSLKVNGPLIIKGTLTCLDNATAKVNGPVKIGKGLLGGEIRINGPLNAQFVEVSSLSINGPVTVDEDVVASDELSFGIGASSKVWNGKFLDIGGVIEAPVVRMTNYSYKYSVTGIIKKVIGMKSKFEKIVVLKNLTIKAKLLELDGVELEECNLDEADEIVQLRAEKL
ncbi:MAG: hypothetical protein ACXAB2_07355 [Candidatus Hodarchaeales archaeon]|jgi:hypothetical protein